MSRCPEVSPLNGGPYVATAAPPPLHCGLWPHLKQPGLVHTCIAARLPMPMPISVYRGACVREETSMQEAGLKVHRTRGILGTRTSIVAYMEEMEAETRHGRLWALLLDGLSGYRRLGSGIRSVQG